MHPSNRFAVAVHVLALAMVAREEAEGRALTSEQMAHSVDKHPVVIRRVLGSLRNAGLVSSQPGPGGGWRLTRSPAEITLCDVYRAVEQEPSLAPQTPEAGPCPIGRRLPTVLEICFRAAETAMEAELARITIADVLASVKGDVWCGADVVMRSDPAGAAHRPAMTVS